MNKSIFALTIVIILLSCGGPDTFQVTVKVIAPPSTPRDARLYIVGNDSLLGDWNPRGVEMTRENDSVWTITRRFPRDRSLEFKITRGSWNAEAIYQPRTIPTNTKIVVHADTVVTLRPIDWSDVAFPAHGGITGTVRYHHAMESEKLQYTRDVIVWLPPSYEKNTGKRYPVLYMHDGQNIIDPSTSSFGYDWRVDEVADSLIRANAIEEIIIVGIYNTPHRGPEYSGTDKGRSYADFVVHNLKPFIDKTYRTKSDRENTAVMGSSMGGLISFLFVWWYPDVFSQAACLSSAFSHDPGNILDEARKYNGPKKKIRIYLDMGSQGVDRSLRAGSDEMFSLLIEKGYKEGVDIKNYFDEGAEHNEIAWASRLWGPLTFIFGRK